MGLSGGSAVKNSLTVQETQEMQVQSTGQEDALEEGMATHSSILFLSLSLFQLEDNYFIILCDGFCHTLT